MIIAISGPSGSGKTTIARALFRLLESSTIYKYNACILHQDDFYKAESDIPLITTRAGPVVNWDCPEALDFDAMIAALRAYREHGQFPSGVEKDLAVRAKEDKNTRTEDIADALLDRYSMSAFLEVQENICIVDGFMLYQNRTLLGLIDIPILLRGSFPKLRERRYARSGYVTQEGFWQDPEGYFEDVVWPEFVKTHAFLFTDEDVEGEPAHPLVAMNHQIDIDLGTSFQFVMEVAESRYQRLPGRLGRLK